MSKIENSIARKYAGALFQSIQQGNLTLVEGILRNIAEQWESHPRLSYLFQDPAVPESEKVSALVEIVKAACSSAGLDSSEGGRVERFFQVVFENDRLQGVRQITESFSECLRQLRNELNVQVITASAISDEERRVVGEKVQNVASSLASIDWDVDPSIIGGAVIRCGDRTLDNSVRGALEVARKALVG